MDERRLATGLGLLSVGLGTAQVGAPNELAQIIGVPRGERTTALLRGIGIRENASGAGILTRRRPSTWIWSRVAGDAMDLALLGYSLTLKDTNKPRAAAATASVAGITAADVLCGMRLASRRRAEPLELHGAITVNRQPQEAYAFWRELENLPRFMRNVISVQPLDEVRSRWRARSPARRQLEWEAGIVEDIPGELIAWRSLGKQDIETSGHVRFIGAPGGRGTEVHVKMRYAPPMGAVGMAAAKLLGTASRHQLHEDLRRFKQLIETGSVVRSDSSPEAGGAARPSGDGR